MTQSFFIDEFVKPKLNDTAGLASASEHPQSHEPSEAAIEHFDVLLGAVTERLKLAVDAARDDASAQAAAAAAAPEQASRQLRMTVLECIEALQQLQATQRYLRALADELGAPLRTP